MAVQQSAQDRPVALQWWKGSCWTLKIVPAVLQSVYHHSPDFRSVSVPHHFQPSSNYASYVSVIWPYPLWSLLVWLNKFIGDGCCYFKEFETHRNSFDSGFKILLRLYLVVVLSKDFLHALQALENIFNFWEMKFVKIIIFWGF